MNLELMLSPLEGASPCGEDMSYSDEFDAIQHARRFDDPTLAQGEWITGLKEADWAYVESLCTQLLGSRSKDIRLAVWLAEAAARTRGFQGLADGYEVLAGLCERYWAQLHPVSEDDDQELRIGNLGWLLRLSPQLLREIPIVESPRGRFTMQELDALRGRHAAADASSDGTLEAARTGAEQERFDAIRRETPPAFLRDSLVQVRACVAALDRFEEVVDHRLGLDGPSFSSTREVLLDVERTFERLLQQAGIADAGRGVAGRGDGAAEPAAPKPAAAGSGLGSGVPAPRHVPSAAGALETREQALERLHEVADFFRRTEPHSPVAYLADKAAQWGGMPLHAWLRSVVKDSGTLSQLEELLGVEQAEEGIAGGRGHV